MLQTLRHPALAAMESYAQWILWRAEPHADGRRTLKLPVHPQTLRTHDAHDPAIWMTADQAFARAAECDAGVGFVFTDADPFVFVDVDACLTADGPTPRAAELQALLPSAVWEVSQSGHGLHAFATAHLPADHPIKCDGFDIYSRARFVALTGWVNHEGCLTVDATEALSFAAARYGAPARPAPATPTAGPRPDWSGPADDTTLVQRMLASRSAATAFGASRATINDLMIANPIALSAAFPDDHGQRPYDESAVDMALFSHLAWWTGADPVRMERIARDCTALYRDKWDRDDYMRRTIARACDGLTSCYSDRPTPPAPSPNAAPLSGRLRAKQRAGRVVLRPEDQVTLFDGCCYISETHTIWVPDGRMLKPDQFKVEYGGYTFILGDDKDARTTDDAWKAFTLSQSIQFPRVNRQCFIPSEQPGELVEGRLNTWRPLWGKRTAGDATPFLDHVRKLFPDDYERGLLLDYMAACVQHAGDKFQWCVAVIGTQGNGKTLLYRVLEHALSPLYCYPAQSHDLDNKFNAWIERKLLIGIDEIKAGNRYETAEILKPLITNRQIAVQAKGQDARLGDNCANFFITSNHADAVHLPADDRRYCILHTAQQDTADSARDGLTGEYWATLWRWLNADGFAIVADYLWTRTISIDVHGRAPDTNAKRVSRDASRSVAEQVLTEAIDTDAAGFRDGMIRSDSARDYLATHTGKRISPEALARVLRQLGYVKHPALEASAGLLRMDNCRTRVYVRAGHPSASLHDHKQIRATLEGRRGTVDEGY